MLSFLNGLTSIGLFLSFGLPVLIGAITIIIVGFDRGSFFSWDGRMNRKSFLINFVIVGVISFIGTLLVAYTINRSGIVLTIIGVFLIIISVLRYLSILARRLHDFNLKGIYALVFFIFNIVFGYYEIAHAIGTFLGLVVMVIPGSATDNDFGEKPSSKISIL